MLERVFLYVRLVRLDKPIGTLLLLWPTLWALWIASGGAPKIDVLLIFFFGTILMRSAGCALNDFADRDFDCHVKRTAQRPLTTGRIHAWEAILVAAILACSAFLLILPFNVLTLKLSVLGLLIAVTYPYFNRFFAFPQAYLGIAFGFGIPMAFASVQNTVPLVGWMLLLANIFWALAYDTEYAMVDRDDDLKIGIRTSAITFGHWDVTAVMICYAIFLVLMLLVGWMLGLRGWFQVGLGAAAACALYHFRLIRSRERMSCFKAFMHNNWLGAVIFVGLILDYGLR